MTLPTPSEFHLARVGGRRSFIEAEKQAREILRERGLSSDQIERELHRPKRREEDQWG